MNEPTLKSEVLGMMPETWRPKTKRAVFNRTIKYDYYLGDMAWSMKISEAKETFGVFTVDAFLSTIRSNIPEHIEDFLRRGGE